MTSSRSLVAALAFAFSPGLFSETLPANHPAGPFVKTYLENIVKQDWQATSSMLLPASLERKKSQIVESIKNSRTMTEEQAKLELLGVKDVREVEKMTPQQAYIADRKAVHNMDQRAKLSPEVLKRKEETLKVNILGLIPEENGKIVHAVVRTRQETLDTSIEELLLVSVMQDNLDAKKWYVAPDMQVPITSPLKSAPEKNEPKKESK